MRKVLEQAESRNVDGEDAESLLMAPTKIYVKPVLALLEKLTVKGLAHITGGGITENLPRSIPDGLRAAVDTTSWRQPAIFDWLQASGRIDTAEMRRTFNCGVGMVVIVDAGDADEAITLLNEHGETAWRLGVVRTGDGPVEYL